MQISADLTHAQSKIDDISSKTGEDTNQSVEYI
jgi:hypothetical protein